MAHDLLAIWKQYMYCAELEEGQYNFRPVELYCTHLASIWAASSAAAVRAYVTQLHAEGQLAGLAAQGHAEGLYILPVKQPPSSGRKRKLPVVAAPGGVPGQGARPAAGGQLVCSTAVDLPPARLRLLAPSGSESTAVAAAAAAAWAPPHAAATSSASATDSGACVDAVHALIALASGG